MLGISKLRVAMLGLAALSLAGCKMFTEPDVVRTLKPANIAHYGDSADIIVPSEVRVGEPFDITVKSFGGGCTTFGETRVNVGALTANVLPFDYEVTHAPRNFACTDILRQFSHTVTLQFSQRGRALIWIFGRGLPGEDGVALVRAVEVK